MGIWDQIKTATGLFKPVTPLTFGRDALKAGAMVTKYIDRNITGQPISNLLNRTLGPPKPSWVAARDRIANHPITNVVGDWVNKGGVVTKTLTATSKGVGYFEARYGVSKPIANALQRVLGPPSP